MDGKRIIGAAAASGVVAAAVVGAERHRRNRKPTLQARIVEILRP